MRKEKRLFSLKRHGPMLLSLHKSTYMRDELLYQYNMIS